MLEALKYLIRVSAGVSIWVSVRLYVCPSVCVFMCRYGHMSVCMCRYGHISVCMCRYGHISVCMCYLLIMDGVYLTASESLFVYGRLSLLIWVGVCLSLRVPIRLYVCVTSVYMAVYNFRLLILASISSWLFNIFLVLFLSWSYFCSYTISVSRLYLFYYISIICILLWFLILFLSFFYFYFYNETISGLIIKIRIKKGEK